MPICEIRCRVCGQAVEVIVSHSSAVRPCPFCGAEDTDKLMSTPSSLSGVPGQRLPGPGDTACCCQSPTKSGCDGPGSCCGRSV